MLSISMKEPPDTYVYKGKGTLRKEPAEGKMTFKTKMEFFAATKTNAMEPMKNMDAAKAIAHREKTDKDLKPHMASVRKPWMEWIK